MASDVTEAHDRWHAGPATKVSGIRGLDPARPNLYDFVPEDGRMVHLHDADCRSVLWDAERHTLDLTFCTGDAPPRLVSMHFDEVEIEKWDVEQWDTDTDAWIEHSGQVAGLDWNAARWFTLELLGQQLEWRAGRLVVGVQPAPPDEVPSD